MNFWQKLSTGLVVVFATVAMSLTAFCFIPTPAEAKVVSTSEIHLFMSNEWKTIVNQPTLEVAAAINQRLDIRRDEIGRAILFFIKYTDWELIKKLNQFYLLHMMAAFTFFDS